MLDRSVAARRFVIQTLDRLLANTATSGQASSVAAHRGQTSSGSEQRFGDMPSGSKN